MTKVCFCSSAGLIEITAFFARDKNIKAILNAVYIHGKAADFLYENGVSKNAINPSNLIYALKKNNSLKF